LVFGVMLDRPPGIRFVPL